MKKEDFYAPDWKERQAKYKLINYCAMAEYDIIQFNSVPNDEYVEIKELEKFIEDAEIVLSSYGMAWSRSFINKVGDSFRGATLEFNDGLMIYGYDVQSKLVRRQK